MHDSLLKKALPIRLVVFDVDGVLTNGKMFYGPNGLEYKEFNVLDGQGIKHLQQTKVEVGIITACKSSAVTQRMKDLGIDHVYQGVADKVTAYEDLKQKLQLTDNQIAYVGDDLPDLPLLNRVGFAITVPNAQPIMHQHASLVTKASGGQGAVREVCELIMRAQGTYETIITSYLSR